MGGLSKKVSKGFGKVVGGLAGGVNEGVRGGMGPTFKANMGKIDKTSFEAIKGADEARRRAEEVAKRAGPAQITPSTIGQGQSAFSRDVATVRRAPAATAATIQQGPGFAGALINQDPQSQLRSQQMQLAQQLQGQVAGTAPSLAEAQLKAQSDRTLAQQLGAAAAQRGGNQAALQRTLANSQAQAGQELGAQGAQMRLAEQLQAQQQLAGLTGQVRGQDLGLASSQAELGQQAGLQSQSLEAKRLGDIGAFQQQVNLTTSAQQQEAELAQAQLVQETRAREARAADERAIKTADLNQTANIINQEAALKQQGLNDQFQQFNLEQGVGIDKFGAQQKQALATLEYQRELDINKMAQASEAGAAAAASQITGGVIGAAGAAAAAASDKNSKKNIKDGSKSSRAFLDSLQSYSYDYKDKKNGKGKQLGVMAQDLEKSGDVGKQMVLDTPDGKMVDYGKGFGAILAAQSDLHKRLNELESKKKKRK